MEAYYHFQNSRHGFVSEKRQSQERKIKRKLISSPVAQEAITFWVAQSLHAPAQNKIQVSKLGMAQGMRWFV